MCWHKLIVYPNIVYSRVQFFKRKEKLLLLTSLNGLGFWKYQLAFGIDWYRIKQHFYLWKHWEASVFCYLKRWVENIEILFFQSELKSLIFITPLNSDDLSSLTLGNELEKSHRSIFFLILLFAFPTFSVCFLLLWQVCQSPLLIDYLFFTFLPFILFPKNVLFMFLFSLIFYILSFIFHFCFHSFYFIPFQGLRHRH